MINIVTIMTMMILMMIRMMILMMIMIMIVLLLVVGPWSMHNSGGLSLHSVGGSRRQWPVGIASMAKMDLVRA